MEQKFFYSGPKVMFALENSKSFSSLLILERFENA